MKLWFKTKENQILNLNECLNFWIEETEIKNMKYRIFCKTSDNIEWNIANFYYKKHAENYLNQIYDLIIKRDDE